jgi:rod shape-determining protein MreC
VILAVVVVLSLLSMAAGTRAAILRDGVTSLVSITAYPFLKILHATEGGADYATNLVFAYNAALREAETTKRQLGEVMLRAAQRNELLTENRRLRRMLEFVREEKQLTLDPVEVLENFKGAVIKVDAGSLRGIQESMCAVTGDGIVGVVTRTDPASSTIVTLRNPDCRVGAMIARNRVRGVVHGSGSDLTPNCVMNYIDMKDDVRAGDLVVASPESVFPTGYPLGRVVAVHDTGSLWKSAEIEPAVNPYRLDEVFVLRQSTTPISALTGAPPDGASALSKAPEMPDKRSLQERYAP